MNKFQELSSDSMMDEIMRRGDFSLFYNRMDTVTAMDHLAKRDGVEDKKFSNKKLRVLAYTREE